MTHVTFIVADLDSIRRGGSSRRAACAGCGWTGPERGTLEMAYDDANTHEQMMNAADRHGPMLVRISLSNHALRCKCGAKPPYGARVDDWLASHMAENGVLVQQLDT